MLETNAMITLATARALAARGWSVVPTASDEEKRPLGAFATAKSWRDFSERLPTDAELLGWFGPAPRRGGVVLHKGQLCIDHDTKEGMPCKCENVEVSNSQQPISNVVWEESAKGWHEFYRCDENARIAHDHERKIDYLTYGSFVRLCQPECLVDWRGEVPFWDSWRKELELEGEQGTGWGNASRYAYCAGLEVAWRPWQPRGFLASRRGAPEEVRREPVRRIELQGVVDSGDWRGWRGERALPVGDG